MCNEEGGNEEGGREGDVDGWAGRVKSEPEVRGGARVSGIK